MTWHYPYYPSQHIVEFQSGNSDGHDVTDGQVLYLNITFATPLLADPSTSAPASALTGTPACRRAGTLREFHLTILVFGTLGTTEAGTLAILVNNTTATNISTGLQWNAITQAYDLTGLNVPLPNDSFWTPRITAPTFSTNPTDTYYAGWALITHP